MDDTEIDWWKRIGSMGWQHIVLVVIAVAGFVALCFIPAMTCSVHISDTTTTTVRR